MTGEKLKAVTVDAVRAAVGTEIGVSPWRVVTQEMVDNAEADLAAQADPNADTSGVEARYPKAKLGDFDGNPRQVTEMDALVAYLQMLGTLVDFSTYDEAAGDR